MATMTRNELVDAVAAEASSIRNGYQVGLRVLPRAASVGDILDPSYRWDDNAQTDDVLDGTCALALRSGSQMDSPVTRESVLRALALAEQYVGPMIAVVVGDPVGSGADDSEVVIANAKIIAVWSR